MATGGRLGTLGLRRLMPAKPLERLSELRRYNAPSRPEGRARPGLVARARACGQRREEQFSACVVAFGQARDFFGSLLRCDLRKNATRDAM